MLWCLRIILAGRFKGVVVLPRLAEALTCTAHQCSGSCRPCEVRRDRRVTLITPTTGNLHNDCRLFSLSLMQRVALRWITASARRLDRRSPVPSRSRRRRLFVRASPPSQSLSPLQALSQTAFEALAGVALAAGERRRGRETRPRRFPAKISRWMRTVERICCRDCVSGSVFIL